MAASLTYFLDFFGIAVFAASGAITASNKRLDIFGVLVVALVTCLGGGTLRDLILDSHPMVWIENTDYLLVGTLSAFLTFFYIKRFQVPMRMLEVCDAIGLAFFAIAGIQRVLTLGYEPGIALLMGLMTGVAGGVIRDVLCNEIPLILHREIYAVAALAGGALFLGLLEFGLRPGYAMLIGMSAILALRLAGIFLGLALPAWLLSEDRPPREE